MRHAQRSQRLSRPSAHRRALVQTLVKSLILHGQLQTTYARAREAQRLAEQLVTFGKDGSVHARRMAFRVLQDRSLVKRLFADIAPRFVDVSGGYTRVVRLGRRRGDGAQKASLALCRLPAAQPVTAPPPKPAQGPASPPPQAPAPESSEQARKPKGFFEGLRALWTKRQRG